MTADHFQGGNLQSENTDRTDKTLENNANEHSQHKEVILNFESVKRLKETDISNDRTKEIVLDSAAIDRLTKKDSETLNKQKESFSNHNNTIESHDIKVLDLNDRLNYLRANPEKADEYISKDSIINRIKTNNEIDAFDISKQSEVRANYLDDSKVKGFVQEEMIRSVLQDDFDVSERTVKAETNEGHTTYIDIVAVARDDIEINGETIKKGETLSIESKSGSEQYLTREIAHINKQLGGMPNDAHKMLFVTADYDRMSENNKDKLNAVLNHNNASLNVLPYYSKDLTDAVISMNLNNENYYPSVQEARYSIEECSETNLNEKSKVLKRDVAELYAEGMANIEQLLDVYRDNYIDKGYPSEEISRMIEDDKTELVRNFLEDAGLNKYAEKPLEKQETDNCERNTQDVEKILSEQKKLKELDEYERNVLVDYAVETAIKNHKPDIAVEEIEIIKQKVSFVSIDEVIDDYNGTITKESAKFIQGYYNSSDGRFRINVDAYGTDVEEVLVTIEHETLHLLAQRFSEESELVVGLTGVKRNDLENSFNNVGMNEGITEMYASDDMSIIAPKREETSYVNEVKIARLMEKAFGAEVLHDAYFSNGVGTLKNEFDAIMGEGHFDELCRTMDYMWYYEKNGDQHRAARLHSDLVLRIDEFISRREKSL